jgi:D-sedoheptulose 7-phosphate isomerase
VTCPLHELGARRLDRVSAASNEFFRRHADALGRAACEMAERFSRGGRLFVCGSGPAASDAQHVSVEFLHPVIVGQRALPAIALGAGEAMRLRTMHQPQDMVLAIAPDRGDAAFDDLLLAARDARLLTLGMSGEREVPLAAHAFLVADEDPTIVQEVEETACHVLHELVHLFLGRSS